MVESDGSSCPLSYRVMLLRYLTGTSASPTAACDTPAAIRADRSRFPNVIPNQCHGSKMVASKKHHKIIPRRHQSTNTP